MSEPTRRADRIDSWLPGIRHWSIHDDRLDFRSDAYAVADARGWVLIDPLPLEKEALLRLGPDIVPGLTNRAPAYVVLPDGDGFVFVRRTRERPPYPLLVKFNWFEELKERVPTGGR